MDKRVIGKILGHCFSYILPRSFRSHLLEDKDTQGRLLHYHQMTQCMLLFLWWQRPNRKLLLTLVFSIQGKTTIIIPLDPIPSLSLLKWLPDMNDIIHKNNPTIHHPPNHPTLYHHHHPLLLPLLWTWTWIRFSYPHLFNTLFIHPLLPILYIIIIIIIFCVHCIIFIQIK